MVAVIFDWVAVITVCFSSDLQSSLEHDVYSRLSNLQEGLIPKKRAGADDDLHRINELIQVTPFLPHRPSKHVPPSGYLLIKTDHWLFQKKQVQFIEFIVNVLLGPAEIALGSFIT